MREEETKDEFLQILSHLLGGILDLAEASIPPPQFRAFRKLLMDMFGEVRRNLNVRNNEMGRCGKARQWRERIVTMIE